MDVYHGNNKIRAVVYIARPNKLKKGVIVSNEYAEHILRDIYAGPHRREFESKIFV
jgi:hypothetical protein